MKRVFPLVFVFVSSCVLSVAAFSDTYISGSVGEAEFSSGGDPDMYEIGLGFDISRSLAIEFSYVNFGVVDSYLGDGELIEEEADGINSALVANIPLNDLLTLFVSAGYLNWDDTARYFDYGEYLDNYTVKGHDWNFGVGIKAEVFEGLDLKFGYTEYKLDDIDVDSITAGIVYRF